MDGSVWSRAVWSGAVGVTLRQIDPQQSTEHSLSPVMNVEVLTKEMDNLRYSDTMLTTSQLLYSLWICPFFNGPSM